jgi:Ca2+-binding RTX toxin-like protein
MEGGEGRDALSGGVGDDRLETWNVGNTQTGGADADTFVFHLEDQNEGRFDTITDFDASEDVILIADRGTGGGEVDLVDLIDDATLIEDVAGGGAVTVDMDQETSLLLRNVTVEEMTDYLV